MRTLLLLLFLSGSMAAAAQKMIALTPFLQQYGIYYSSDRVTSDGLGVGVGIHALHKTGVAGQMDVNLFWGCGNAVSTRLALGYQRKGRWTPGAYATMNLLWGQRIEALDAEGNPPAMPAWAAGIRVTPLKFSTPHGFVSALEIGAGLGPSKAVSLEVSILSAGITF